LALALSVVGRSSRSAATNHCGLATRKSPSPARGGNQLQESPETTEKTNRPKAKCRTERYEDRKMTNSFLIFLSSIFLSEFFVLQHFVHLNFGNTKTGLGPDCPLLLTGVSSALSGMQRVT
jgi:hypothetical protein